MSKSIFNNNVKALILLVSLTALGGCAPQPAQEDAIAAKPSTCANGSIRRGDCKLLGLTEPAPETNPDLWHHIINGYQLTDFSDKPRVQEYFGFYRDRPVFLQTITERSSRYMHYIVEAINERNMPMEFALLPAIESSFDPFAYSHGRAAGLWQFVPVTAKHMGLPRTWWYDGRRDVMASTEAALDYLLELHSRFDGDWLLAMAAYNSGATTVNRAIRRNRKAGRDTDFWSLSLPEETEAYIPKLIALTQLIKQSEQEGISIASIPNEATFEIVETNGQIDLAQAAELAGISIDEMYHYNPGYNRWATDPNGPHRLAIPIGNAPQFKAALAEIPSSQRLNWSRYRVEPGDSLIKIARHFNTDVATIKAANKLSSNTIRAGQTLLLPSASMADSHYSLSEQQRLASAQQKGQSTGKQSVYHQVKSGESLWTISRKYGVGTKELARWNNMVPKDPLQTGRKLVIWQSKPISLASSERDNRSVIRWVAYTVRRGDSLARIADRFSVNVNEIAKWNNIDTRKYLKPGQVLSLYVDVTQLSGR